MSGRGNTYLEVIDPSFSAKKKIKTTKTLKTVSNRCRDFGILLIREQVFSLIICDRYVVPLFWTTNPEFAV